MHLDEECKSCLYNSQLKKVEKTKGGEKLALFKEGVKTLTSDPPENYCSPLLMRDINLCHKRIFGEIIDYSEEKRSFNSLLLGYENGLFDRVISSSDPIAEGLKLAMASNYIDFARLSDLDGNCLEQIFASAEKAEPDKTCVELLKDKLKAGESVCYLLDNCGEIVLDKILIRTISKLYPDVKVTAVVRGAPVINDVTEEDAKQTGLYGVCNVVNNGTDVPGTYLKEISEKVRNLLDTSGIIISKGLGNLETLYGEKYSVFYAFTCKCEHIAKLFSVPLWSACLKYV